jgi:hypothetical protein
MKVKCNKTEYDKLRKEFEIFDNPKKMIDYCIDIAIQSECQVKIDEMMGLALIEAKKNDDFLVDSLIAKIEEKYQERR